jgi:hypothetical protein
MNEQDYSFDEISNWVISLMRPKTNSRLKIYAPEEMALMLDLVSLDPNSEATSKAFDAISTWVSNNFPKWGIINIEQDYKVEL